MASPFLNLSSDLDDSEEDQEAEVHNVSDHDTDDTDEEDDNVDEEVGKESGSVNSPTSDVVTKKGNSNKSKVIMWNGQRLHPPQRRAANPSKVWQLAGFLKNNLGVLDQTKAVCSICGHERDYKGSPSVMQFHLQTNHPDEFNDVGNNQPQMTDFFNISTSGSQSHQKKLPVNHPKQVSFNNCLAEWIIENNRPFSTLEDPKLVKAFEIANPNIKVPNRKKIRNMILDKYNQKFKETVDEFKEIEFFSATTDAGTSLGNKSFVDLNVHYLDAEFKLKKKIVDVAEMTSNKTADNYRELVDEKLEKFGIKEKTFSFCTDNEATMRKCFRGIRTGCLSHISSKSSKRALEDQNDLCNLRAKFRKVSKKANKSSKFKYAITKEQEKKGVNPITLKQEVETRFSACHTMLRSIANDPNYSKGETKPINKAAVTKNISAINAAMLSSNIPRKERDELVIHSNDIDMIVAIIPVLDVLEEMVSLAGAEKNVTGSSVMPYIHKIKRVAGMNATDPVFVGDFKKIFLEDFLQRCDENLDKNTLLKSTFFDKRFHSSIEKYIEICPDFTLVELEIELQTELQDILNNVLEENVVDEVNNEKTKKRKVDRSIGRALLDSDEEDERIDMNSVNREFTAYKLEPKLGRDGDPLAWWNSKKDKYPIMARLARKYMVVQATSTAAERAMSKLGLILTKKRLSLDTDLFSNIMFLSDCK